MAISLFNEERAYSLNHIRSKPFKGGYLVTTDYGSWAYLTQDEFELLKKEKLKENSELFSMLKDKGIVLTGENINRVVEDYRNRMSYLFQGTSLHIVVVTLRCNHKCVYCHSAVKGEHAQGYDMDEETPVLKTGALFKVIRYYNLGKTEMYLRRLLGEFRFSSIGDILASQANGVSGSSSVKREHD